MTQLQQTETSVQPLDLEVEDPQDLDEELPEPKFWFFRDHQIEGDDPDPELQLSWREVLLLGACLRAVGAGEGHLELRDQLELAGLSYEDYSLLFRRPLNLEKNKGWVIQVNRKLWPMTVIPQPEGEIFWSTLELYGIDIMRFRDETDSDATIPELLRLFDKALGADLHELLPALDAGTFAEAKEHKAMADAMYIALKEGYYRYMATEEN